MSAIVVNAAGLAVIALIVWWFWLSGPRARAVETGPVDIVVDGGVYSPARVQLKAGRAVTLRFLRKDPSPCAEKVVFDDLGIAEDLPVGQWREIRIVRPAPGEYEFTCQMHMYRGTLVVTE
ncbi:MAG: cupredoxin domain-containing protein [Gammaproteobacteria bacterium]|nr:cupredoxin domain-containing protein [Gammaproteobacteria bacterium]NIR97682.1 cupredoxin domain-containing protein [Gammaproteobacteria bacterium]NIT63348.1 cupredoxin domain-containing protein [Gammaproteobacteria bacterium]NIV20275.1 cupredoxin domain-containing protein [Gammaproteobacteria bacterium]NIX10692.1 cupredoxin domain-containing protein [Gammaproteobacteria bacterium]